MRSGGSKSVNQGFDIVAATWQQTLHCLRVVRDHFPEIKRGSLEIRDLVSLTITALGAFLAYLAIKLGREQTKIAAKMMAIWEKQDQLLSEQLTRRAVLTLEVRGSSYGYTDEGLTIMRAQHSFHLVNSGSKLAKDIYFKFTAPWESHCKPQFVVTEGTSFLASEEEWLSEDEANIFVEGRCSRPIYPGQEIRCAEAFVEMPRPEFLQ